MRLIASFLSFLGLFVAAAAMAQATPAVVAPPPPDPQNILHLELSTGGSVVIAMRPDKAPAHVERIKTLTRAGFYDGVVFHRVIEGFMAQTGDPQGTGEGGSPLPDLKAEFNDLMHLRGSVAMARTDQPDTANSQFFICFLPVLRLDGKYTVLGRVTKGMEFVDVIARGEPPASPSRIVKAWIEADGPNAPRQALVVPPPGTAPVAAEPVAATPPPAQAEATPPPAPEKPKRKKLLGIF